MEQHECLIPAFDLLSEEQKDYLIKNCFPVKHRPGEIIFMQDRPVTHLMFIKSGLLKLYKQIDENNEIIIEIISENNFIGLASVFYQELYPYSASSIQGGELIYINAKSFKDVINQNGPFATRILELLSSRAIYLINRMISLTKKQVPGRMAEMLLHFSRNVFKSNTITLPLSRQEIADLVQSTKETVSRTLTEFKNDRIIDLDDRNVTLKSIDLLEILNKIG